MKEGNMKKKISLTVVLTFLLLLIGCGKAETTEHSSNQMEKAYSIVECNTNEICGSVKGTFIQNRKLYTGLYNKEKVVSDGRYAIHIYDPEKKTEEIITLKGQDNRSFRTFSILENGQYEALFYQYDAELKTYTAFWLDTFDASGNLLIEREITDAYFSMLQGESPDFFCIDAKGNLYYETADYGDSSAKFYIYKINTDGEGIFLKEWEHRGLGISAVNGDAWYVCEDQGTSASVYNLSKDEELLHVIGTLKKNMNTNAVFIYGDETDLHIQMDGMVYLSSLSMEKLTNLFSLEEVGLQQGTLNTVAFYKDQQDNQYVLHKISDKDGEKKYDWGVIQSENAISNKEIITIAVAQKNTALVEAVTQYNKSSDCYRAEIVEYENDQDGISSALQTDIIAGKIPDLMSVDVIDMDVMISKGILADLSDNLAQDVEIGKDDFVGHSLEIYKRGEKLYALPTALCVTSFVGKEALLNGIDRWNMVEFKEYLKNLPDSSVVTQGFSKDEMLYFMLDLYLEEYVDWDTKQSYFEDEDFKELLEFVNLYQDHKEDMQENMATLVDQFMHDEIILYPNGISNIYDYRLMKALWGEEVKYIGFPSKSGTGIELQDVATAYVVAKDSPYREELWKILKMLVTDERNIEAAIPAYKPSFDKMCERAQEKRMVVGEDGISHEVPEITLDVSGMEIQIFAADKQEIDQFIELVEKAEAVGISSVGLKKIIQEESGGYFKGQKSLDEVASIIQNRAGMYLNE